MKDLKRTNMERSPGADPTVTKLLRDLKGAWESLISLQAARVDATGDSPRSRGPASYGKV